MDKRLLTLLIVLVILIPTVYWFFNQNTGWLNQKPTVKIMYPAEGTKVMNLVTMSGTAFDPEDSLVSVEVRIDDGDWISVVGTMQWSYEWNIYDASEGSYLVSVRSYDGDLYSDVVSITVQVETPDTADSSVHKWAVFIAAANFPEKNESKLGNGGLNLAEEMVGFFIDTYQYPASHVFVLFDDGWIRADNGYGDRVETLQERPHSYDITYGAATKQTVFDTLNYVIEESNQYDDSEVFIWVFNHGYGDENNTVTGGKLLSSSWIFLWDDVISDKDLGDALQSLQSKKMCLIVDACYAGGFADKTIFNMRTSLLLRSGIPKNGRIVIAGASKFRKGYASTTEGPLFSMLWFEGLQSGDADGFRPGLLGLGKPTRFKFLQDGKVSVEEAFYYARYTLSTDKDLKEYRSMQPQINDRYPRRGLLLSRREMVFGVSS
ncbi:MAG: Ig-like domain-containing protein [Methanobacteriota archaeon]